MRTLLIAALALAALPCWAGAGEPKKQTKAERIKWLEADLPSARAAYAEWLKDDAKREANGAKQNADTAKWAAALARRIAAQELELSYLRGVTTRAAVEAEVKTAKDAVKAAEEAKKPTDKEKAALDVAQKRLALIEKWEGDY